MSSFPVVGLFLLLLLLFVFFLRAEQSIKGYLGRSAGKEEKKHPLRLPSPTFARPPLPVTASECVLHPEGLSQNLLTPNIT